MSPLQFLCTQSFLCKMWNYAESSAVKQTTCAGVCSGARWSRGVANELLKTWLPRMSSVSFSLLYLSLLSLEMRCVILPNIGWTPGNLFFIIIIMLKNFFSRAAASISSIMKWNVNWAGAITRCSLLLLARMLPQEAVCPVMLKMKVIRTFLI